MLSRVRRLSDVDRHLFCPLEHLVVQYLVEATERCLRVNNGPLYVCSTLFGANVVTASRHRHHPQAYLGSVFGPETPLSA